MNDLHLWAWGMLGGAVAEFVAVARHRRDAPADWPAEFGRWQYWIFTPIWIFVGGLVAYLTLGEATAIGRTVPFQLGATAPLFLERLFSASPSASLGKVEQADDPPP